ncbi:MAG: hypothetical protein V1244_08115 [Nitrospinaceae bacterium]|nr:hypothetical protein [Nitrospinaceae bacterium]
MRREDIEKAFRYGIPARIDRETTVGTSMKELAAVERTTRRLEIKTFLT